MKDNGTAICQHYWLLSTPAYGEHIIGKCRLCGAEKDFTILLAQDKGYKQLCLADTLTRPEVTMERIMSSSNGNGKKPRKPRLSRGRVR